METIGRKWVFGIGLYLIIKGALNLILGFSMSNLVMLIVSVVALVLMLNRVPYINYIVAVFQQSGQPVDLSAGRTAGSGCSSCAGV